MKVFQKAIQATSRWLMGRSMIRPGRVIIRPHATISPKPNLLDIYHQLSRLYHVHQVESVMVFHQGVGYIFVTLSRGDNFASTGNHPGSSSRTG